MVSDPVPASGVVAGKPVVTGVVGVASGVVTGSVVVASLSVLPLV